MKQVGSVFFVGAGPGDPELITVKGLKCIQSSDVILYDRLANPELLKYAGVNTELIYCGKQPNHHYIEQTQINAIIIEKALEGKTVTRLKGGDPCVFGRIQEELEGLKELGVHYEIVPGITAGIAAPAYAGISVTQRKVATSFAMVAGHLCHGNTIPEEKWKAYAVGIDTLAFYMGISNIAYIRDRLIDHGRDPDTPAAIISWGTTSTQRTLTGTLQLIPELVREHEVRNPAIILVGEVVRMHDQYAWFPEQPVEMFS
ncbi:uroporphyrinogen-III C-methyltransferase [Paenibacillus zeisoli]|uniref:Uroporphyrinogen-III C-methyltransferase n=1 Tax=Paenibacillus zeisoli TaxID=2496267 RepID=A0A3S1D2S9_9BACL|nr:uroporphyrinogen-III C-methyltransferase [Paenibacillus zeisoli]RUT35676.1 uroporphyrinogen-III C-methyltransferase [Paenibacillus zeisoli]